MIHRARWVLPIDRPPLDDGWVETLDGRIVGLGHGAPPRPAIDLGDVALLPGLVNAHTHLELSWMAGRVPPAASMTEWITTLIRERRAKAIDPDREQAAAAQAAEFMRASGTVLVGDISNSLITPALIAAAGLSGVVFHELLGFNALEPEALVRSAWGRADAAARPDVRTSVVAHAPYSVSPSLFQAIAGSRREAPLAVHLAECHEEIEFIRTGRGPMRTTLEMLNAWTDRWTPPGCEPDEYLHALGYLQPGTIVVHGVHLTDGALARLAARQAVLVTCPRSNLWVGAGSPRLARMYASGVPVAVGTDSLASVSTLNLFDELEEMRRLAPEVTAATLLESATRVGAEALGWGAEYGTLSAGKRAAILSVAIPAGTTDVEEYLVSGVPAADVRMVPGS